MEGKFAIIVTVGQRVYFLFGEEDDTRYFASVEAAENWIVENSRTGHDYTVWDCENVCICD